MSRRDESIAAFREYRRILAESDPEIVREIEAALREAPMVEAAGRPDAEFRVETIVLTKGRPVLDIRGGETVIAIDELESQVWKARLAGANARIAPNIPAVGRIELRNHPRGVDWLGTGWLIRSDIVVTNRHVAEVFGAHDGSGFVFRPGFDDTPMQARIDFLEEFDREGEHEFPLLRILHVESGGGPDLAFLRVAPVADQDLPACVAPAAVPARSGDQIAVIGYPARDPYFPDPALMDRIFDGRYDKKRLAPGLVTGTSAGRLFHDCSTLGGNSGGEIISLETGDAVALHFAGTLFEKNHAVPIEVVEERLNEVLRGRIRRPSRPLAADSEALAPPRSSPASRSRVLEVTVPVRVRVEIGDPIADDGVGPGAAPLRGPDPEDDLIEIAEARPEDYLDREGYQADFLGEGIEVPLPVLTANEDDTLTFRFDGEERRVLAYRNFSVLMSRSRRICRFSACNLDGKQSKSTERSGWRFDPRIPKAAQIMKECYGNPPRFARGHMTRREDPAWGSRMEAHLGNRDSMHVTNAAPQMQPFNAGVWLELEDYALQNARKDDMRICVFTGPFLGEKDPVRFGVEVPVSFWKVIAFVHDETGELCATGYTMSQQSFIGEEEFVFGRHENDQRPIAEIERRARISFGRLADLDPLKEQPESLRAPLTELRQIRFR